MIEMGAKSITIVRAVTADFFFDCRAAEVLRMSELGTYHGTSTMMRKTLDWMNMAFLLRKMHSYSCMVVPS
jgi:hypothetical protein